MIILRGKFAEAKVFTDNVEQQAISQIIELLNQPFAKDSKVRIMPDVHAGKGCVVGFTAQLGDKVIPSLIGVDIGCGMETTWLPTLEEENVDLPLLEKVIVDNIPSGRNVNAEIQDNNFNLKELSCYEHIKSPDYVMRSIGSLGGGNHFIELNVSKIGQIYLVIHSGSRSLGKQVAEYYQDIAVKQCSGVSDEDVKEWKQGVIGALKAVGDHKKIQYYLKRIDEQVKQAKPHYPKDLCFLEGQAREDYLHDMNLCVKYADLNRKTMVNNIVYNYFGRQHEPYPFESFTTIHNYIDTEDGVIRKGAIKAEKGKLLLIPLNRRDGSLLASGKSNPDWNNSAPHGAGRVMSRSKAKELLNVDDYKLIMEGIYATNVDASTLDESPLAYKPAYEIRDNIEDTVKILDQIKPLYNFKAGE